MPRKPVMKPRKRAIQQRSLATVEALIDATARILVREGFDKASTNRIAEVAGVSIGSLYQYFPGKEALVVAVAKRHGEALFRVAHRAFAEAAGLPLERGIRALVSAAVAAHRVDSRLHRVLSEEIPRVGGFAEVGSFNRAYYALFRTFLEAHRNEVRTLDAGLAVFVCMTAVEALTHNAVLHHADAMTGEDMDGLVDEATLLVTGYLKR